MHADIPGNIIERLAREADPAGEHGKLYEMALLTPDTLRKLARLVAEECAKECETLYGASDYWGDGECFAAAIRAKFGEGKD